VPKRRIIFRRMKMNLQCYSSFLGMKYLRQYLNLKKKIIKAHDKFYWMPCFCDCGLKPGKNNISSIYRYYMQHYARFRFETSSGGGGCFVWAVLAFGIRLITALLMLYNVIWRYNIVIADVAYSEKWKRPPSLSW